VLNDFLKVAVYRMLYRTKWLLGREHMHELIDISHNPRQLMRPSTHWSARYEIASAQQAKPPTQP